MGLNVGVHIVLYTKKADSRPSLCPRARSTPCGEISVKITFQLKEAAFPREMVDFRTDKETDTEKDIMFDNVPMIEERAQGMKGAVKGMGTN